MADGFDNFKIANQFVDAFYSFNKDSLKAVLSDAEESQPNIMYYQKWAECGHYEVIDRGKYFERNDSVVTFPVTVKDDLMKALGINFNVTDTFYILIQHGRIRSVTNSSNDLDEYYKAKEWVKNNYTDSFEIACRDIWNGGPTPCECIQLIVKGFAEYKAQSK